MKRKMWLLITVLAVMGALIAACTPSGGTEGIAADPTEPVVENAEENELESTENTEGTAGSALQGIRWVLVSYLSGGQLVDALEGVEATAEFGADGRVVGGASCNQYFAEYTVDGGNLTVGEIGRTLMACDPPEMMQQEDEFLAALHSAATFAVVDGLLTLANADGETVLTMAAVEPAGLVGTSWVGLMVNTGTEAVTNVLEGTSITANFTEDGKLNGSAGCNNYMTSYTLDGDAITIGPAATTRKLCNEPAGVMEQEAAFVQMLEQAATYRISGDTLELRTADGALIVSFSVAQ